MTENLENADIGARLKEEAKILENYLVKHGKEMPKSVKDIMTLRLIAYQNIIKGDKPNEQT